MSSCAELTDGYLGRLIKASQPTHWPVPILFFFMFMFLALLVCLSFRPAFSLASSPTVQRLYQRSPSKLSFLYRFRFRTSLVFGAVSTRPNLATPTCTHTNMCHPRAVKSLAIGTPTHISHQSTIRQQPIHNALLLDAS